MQKEKVKRRLPDWFKVKFPTGDNFHELKEKFSKASLNTVCEEAACLILLIVGIEKLLPL
ncbi:MAG: hypothetical protein Ct9H90mP2_02670 [Dehalococcoidia bacterium]|nr:MAG: hypothetical protein Ct9H90mP2_02670 [Dehalococcoidia bacterium]